MKAELAGGAAAVTVAHGLQVLRAFRSERCPLSNAELARRTGLSKSTVSKLTTTLLQLGLIGHAADGRHFELASGLQHTGNAFIETSTLLRTVQPVMRGLTERLDVLTTLAIPDDLDILHIAVCTSPSLDLPRPQVGSVLPMESSMSGHACLWAMPLHERNSLVLRINQKAGSKAQELALALQRSYSDLDADGTCWTTRETIGSTLAMSIPLRVGRQAVLMSLGCRSVLAVSNLTSTRERVAVEMKAAAVQLANLLAGTDGHP